MKRVLLICALLLSGCSAGKVAHTPSCPPNPNVPGFSYVCGPGVADGHRGETCINHPPQCGPNEKVIKVDPTNSNPDCVVANEKANALAGGAQLDPYGDCPPGVAFGQPAETQPLPTTIPDAQPASPVIADPHLTG